MGKVYPLAILSPTLWVVGEYRGESDRDIRNSPRLIGVGG